MVRQWERWSGLPRRGRSDRGAALAEFALVLPVLMLIMFGIFEMGIAMNRAQSIEAAAREGARVASISASNAGDVTNRVNAVASFPVNAPVISPSVCNGREGQQVTVVVTGVHNVNIPFWGNTPITLRGEAEYRCEA